MDNLNNKKFILISVSISIIFLIVGASFAWARWEGETTDVTFTVGNGFTCSANGGGNITSSTVKLAPASCTDSSYAIKRTITVNTTQAIPIELNMWLNINQIDAELAATENFRYALTTNQNSCSSDVVASGSFEGANATTNNKIVLLDELESQTAFSRTYYLYIWLDEEETDVSTANKSFSFSLGGECSDEITKKYYAALNSWSDDYKQPEYIENITSIEVVHNKNVPEGAISFNLGISPSQTDDVVGWLEDDGSGNGTYKLYIGAEGTIKIKYSYGSCAFHDMTKVSSVNLNDMDFTEATDIALLFKNVGKQVTGNVTIDVGNNFYTPNVTTTREMFYGVGQNASNLSINFGNKFLTNNVANMSQMFAYMAGNIPNLDLSLSFNTSSATNMYQMFEDVCINCSGNVNINLGNHFNTSNVTDMESMFRNVAKNTNNFTLNLGNKFNPHLVENLSRMFQDMGSVATNFNLNLGNNFNTSSATDMSHMFKNVARNTNNFTLNLGDYFYTGNVTNMAYMFSQLQKNVTGIWTLNLGNHFDTSKVTNMSGMFEYTSDKASNVYLDLGDSFNTSLVTDMSGFMNGLGSGSNATEFYLNLGNHFDTSSLELANYMLRYAGTTATNPTIYLGNKFNFSKVKYAVDTFKGTGGHSNHSIVFDFSTGNFSNIIDASNMFTAFWGTKPTIYVDSADTKQWILNTYGESSQTFSAANIIVK